jgi:hypothetical protein
MSRTQSTDQRLSAKPCSHAWIDPDEASIARAPYSPVIGPRRREMKEGRTYRCQNCGTPLVARSINQPMMGNAL